jgi:hypothetical protein
MCNNIGKKIIDLFIFRFFFTSFLGLDIEIRKIGVADCKSNYK